MITEEALTDELIAKSVLGWEFDPEVGWLTRENTVESNLPPFSIDLSWTGPLWKMALPIIIDKMLQLKICEEGIFITQYNFDYGLDYVRLPGIPAYPLTASTINSTIALIVLNAEEF